MIAAVDPHHDGSPLYVSDAAPAPGARVAVRLRVPHTARVDAVHVRTTPDAEHHFTDARVVHRDETEAWWQAELTCHNPVTNYRFLLEGGEAAYRWLNGTGVHLRDVPDAGDFRIVSHPAPPDWAQDAVVYQVFPDRFARDATVQPVDDPDGPRHDLPEWAVPARWDDPVDLGRGGGQQVYGGTLDGIREHLDHLVALGVSVLYLTPVFPARSNHRYDASSFTQVDPVLGGTEALLRLQEAAHAAGLRVMGDITTNHTGAGHEWYAEARRDPDGERGSWYVRDPDLEQEWVCWLGVPSLPKLDHTNPAVREALTQGPDSVIQRWLGPGRGLDSWRVDVANMTGRYKHTDLTHQVAQETRAAVDAATGGQGLLVAEHAHDHSGDVPGDGWHGSMNYSGFTRPLWTWLRGAGQAPRFLGSPLPVPRLGAELVAETMREFSAIVPWRSLVHSLTMVGSHDTTRVRTLVGDDRDLVVVAAGMLLTMPGIPMLAYGDEIGLPGRTGEDGRRPMPWAARHDPEVWDEDLYAAYQGLVALRRTSPALRRGGMRWLWADGDAMVFLRELPEQSTLVHLARAGHAPLDLEAATVPGIIEGEAVHGTGLEIMGDAGDGATLRLRAQGPAVNVWTWTTPAPPAWAPAAEQRTTRCAPQRDDPAAHPPRGSPPPAVGEAGWPTSRPTRGSARPPSAGC